MSNSADGIITESQSLSRIISANTLSRSMAPSPSPSFAHIGNSTLPRTQSMRHSRGGPSDLATLQDAPPKPSRAMKYSDSTTTLNQMNVSYQASGSDSGNGSGDSVQSCSATGDGSESTTPVSTLPHQRPSGVVIKNPRYGLPTSCSSSTLKGEINVSRRVACLQMEGLHTFQRNSQIVLQDSKVDDLLLDMFRTEFHLKFLWGSKGSSVNFLQRYKKFEQILNVMSAKCQSDEDSSKSQEPTPDPFADPLQLKKALEWELSLDNRDLRSHAWYHGAIPRSRAEEIIENEGDFLIRDCTSQPGNYVLSCMSKTQYLHFVINKVVIQPDTVYERVQFQFEDDLFDSSGSDSGNGSGDSVQSCSATGDGSESTTPVSTLPHQRPSGVVIKNPRYGLPTSCSSSTLKAFTYDSLLEDEILSSYPEVQLPSCFDLDNFQTLLLPTLENKPLDATALQGIHMMLLETGSRILANHLTRIDLQYTTSKDLPKYDQFEHLIGKLSGIELCTLPIGKQLRYDVIERAQCMKLVVAITILTCGSDSERAEILNKWIQVAVDTKTALGNLFGFSNIMLGLMMPQIQRLSVTWHVLRQKFTDSAFSFEAKLRPTLKSMNECTNPNAPNTTIPYMLPLILLQERSLEDVSSQNSLECLNLVSSCITCWETSSSDFGLSILFNHLESARKLTEGLHTFQRNSQIVLQDSKVDDLLLDMFRTEFHLKFLWGSKGSSVNFLQRYKKFEQILNVMSAKCQSDEDSSKSVSSNGCEVSNGHSQNVYNALGTNV
ncbi:breast cancer anti-estrogen resistance protein 3-like [Diaphorina citri]|uniref:Breast cancer anti-estrogen resistance protein 3-like n=1 Tax=Diaphorina citri TaxID=121845 RepID=A0A3Q0J878_DIACI|nr:breast cancer anti-estrogen resistance protein 3-like [Diaphorina citri]